MREDTRTILFAAVVCVACSLLLSGTAAALKSRQTLNVEFDVQRNIIKAFGEAPEDPTREAIQELFEKHIEELVINAESGQVIEGLKVADIPSADLDEKNKLPLYTWSENGSVVKYAFPISGKGLWSMLYGYLSLNSDLVSIAGISFYKHGETPGLGAEIEKDWFLSQFPGKCIYAEGHPLEFVVTKGGSASLPPDQKIRTVDGISGATLTGVGVQKLINADAARYNDYFNSINGK